MICQCLRKKATFWGSDWGTGDGLLNYKDDYTVGIEDGFSDLDGDLESSREDQFFSSMDDDVDDQPLIMSCTHCYTRDVIESWQFSEDEDSGQTSIYCKHCGEEFDSMESFEWESQFLNPEGRYAFDTMMCGNCYEDISLIGVRFEDGAANVECPHCKVNITASVPE